MVHALEEIHRLLKPAGRLIDMHPMAESVPVELHQDGKVSLVGEWSVRQWLDDYRQADSSLAEIIQRGVFSLERESIFDSLTHYDSVSEMLTDLKAGIERFARDAQVAVDAVPEVETLAAQAEERLQRAGNGADLILRERIHILRLKPA